MHPPHDLLRDHADPGGAFGNFCHPRSLIGRARHGLSPPQMRRLDDVLGRPHHAQRLSSWRAARRRRWTSYAPLSACAQYTGGETGVRTSGASASFVMGIGSMMGSIKNYITTS